MADDDQTPAPEPEGDQGQQPPEGERQEDDQGPVTRREFETLREEQGLFFAEVRETLGKLVTPPAPEPEPEPEPERLAPERKSSSPKETAKDPAPEPEPRGYGSKRWFGGRG